MPRTVLLTLLLAIALCGGCLAEEFELLEDPLPDECDVDDFTNCVCSLAADRTVLEPECDDNETPEGEDCVCIFDGDCDNTVDPGCVCFLEDDEDTVAPVCVEGATPEMQGCFCDIQVEEEDN